MSAAPICDRAGCENPITGYDAWGQWCDDHNGGRSAAFERDALADAKLIGHYQDAEDALVGGDFSVCELMEAWGELDQAIQRCYIPGRLEAERYPEEHLHDLRVKRDRMSRAITSLYLAQVES